ncbi:MAG: hypothetical protein K2N84_00335, partial [Clostridia bacterium]|nr:hypothetical protein [Clostridia bacterium]
AIAPKEQTAPKDGDVKYDGKNKSLLELVGLDPFDEGKYYEVLEVSKYNPNTGEYDVVDLDGFDYNDVEGTGNYKVKLNIIDPTNVKWSSGGTTAVTREANVLKQKLTIADWSSASGSLDEPNVTDADGNVVENYRAYFDVEFYDLDNKLVSGKESWNFGWDDEKYAGQQFTMKLVLKSDDNVEVTEGSEVNHTFIAPAAKPPEIICSTDPTISVKDPNYDTGVDATYTSKGVPVDITGFDGKLIGFLTTGTIEIRVNGEIVKTLSDVVLKDAGTYEIELRITKNFTWNNGGKLISQTIEVHKQQLVAPTLSDFTFDGKNHDAASLSEKGVLSGFDSATMKLTFDGAMLRNVGNYTVVISLKDPANYVFIDDTEDVNRGEKFLGFDENLTEATFNLTISKYLLKVNDAASWHKGDDGMITGYVLPADLDPSVNDALQLQMQIYASAEASEPLGDGAAVEIGKDYWYALGISGNDAVNFDVENARYQYQVELSGAAKFWNNVLGFLKNYWWILAIALALLLLILIIVLAVKKKKKNAILAEEKRQRELAEERERQERLEAERREEKRMEREERMMA